MHVVVVVPKRQRNEIHEISKHGNALLTRATILRFYKIGLNVLCLHCHSTSFDIWYIYGLDPVTHLLLVELPGVLTPCVCHTIGNCIE